MTGLKKRILPALLGLAVLAVMIAGQEFLMRSKVQMPEMSSMALSNPRLVHRFIQENPADQFSKSEAGSQQGEDLIPVTGETPLAIDRLEKTPSLEDDLPEGCEAQPDQQYVDEVLELVNEEREKSGAPVLKVDYRLAEAARKHSQDMACRNFFSHENPDGASPFDRMIAEGYPLGYAAENLYAGNSNYNSPHMAVIGWLNSSSHREAMLNPVFNEVGVGYYYNPASYLGGFFAMEFGRQFDESLTPNLIDNKE